MQILSLLWFPLILCEVVLIFFSLFAVSAFWGVIIRNLWRAEETLLGLKIIASIPLVLFPEIGALIWAIFFAQRQTVKRRIVAALSGIFYLLLQFGIFYVSSNDHGYSGGIISAAIMHFLWLPGIIGFSFPLSKKFLPNEEVIEEPLSHRTFNL